MIFFKELGHCYFCVGLK